MICEVLSNPSYRIQLAENALHSVKPLSAEAFGLHAETFYKEVLEQFYLAHPTKKPRVPFKKLFAKPSSKSLEKELQKNKKTS